MKKTPPRKNISDLCKKLRQEFDAWETTPSPPPVNEAEQERQRLYHEIKEKIEKLSD